MLAPGYVLPSRKTVTNSILPQLYESTIEIIKNKLKNVTPICLTTDTWTSINNESYIAITAHFINEETLKCRLFSMIVNISQPGTQLLKCLLSLRIKLINGV